MRRLSMPLLLIALMCVPLVVCAQVYKWKDASGTVHYSDTPPPHGVTYTSVKIHTGAIATASAGTAGSSESGHAAAADSSDEATSQRMTDTPDNREKLCANLQANIKLLNGSTPVITRNAKGEQSVMTKDHRSQELATEQKQYEQYCQG